MKRLTKILATVGPAINSKEKIKEMVLAGADAFRLNFSHATYEDAEQSIKWIREVEAELNKPIAILQDLQGPKIRIGKVDKEYILTEGDIYTLDSQEDKVGNGTRCYLPHKEILEVLSPGDSIFINDGLIKMKVLEVSPFEAKCEVTTGGKISSNKGINLPGVDLPITAMTNKDHKDVRYTIDNDLDVDWIALSFIQRPEDVKELREIVGDKYKIMGKIEMPQAVDRIEEILPEVDGIMVARGDLGVEIQYEKVPVVQKSLIKQAQDMGKLVVVATQMLDSMINNPSPTRAEVSDIANAVFDGADAVMLSNESAVGKHPTKAVEAMRRIASYANHAPFFMAHHDFYFAKTPIDEKATEDVITASASIMAEQLNAAALICYTTSGSTAKSMSRQRPTTTIWGFTPDKKVARSLALNYGIEPRVVDYIDSVDLLIPYACSKSIELDAAIKGDKIVITFGSPIGQLGSTNTIKIATV